VALGAIEDAEALVFSSGQAASMALMLSLTGGRERLVMAADGYYSTRRLAGRLRPNGVQPVHVDLLDVPAVEPELARPAVLWVETPTNPLLRVANLARLAEVAGAAGAPMVVDNTLATRALQQPLAWGAAGAFVPHCLGPGSVTEVVPTTAQMARICAYPSLTCSSDVRPEVGTQSAWELLLFLGARMRGLCRMGTPPRRPAPAANGGSRPWTCPT
jgi:Cys/Met metabolism PLP-dependent enzyme